MDPAAASSAGLAVHGALKLAEYNDNLKRPAKLTETVMTAASSPGRATAAPAPESRTPPGRTPGTCRPRPGSRGRSEDEGRRDLHGKGAA